MKLELRQESGGPRLYLGDDGLHAGVGLELELGADVWIAGRYEYSISDTGKLRPLLFVGYACGHPSRECGCELAIGLPENASVRRPPPSWSRERRSGVVLDELDTPASLQRKAAAAVKP